MSRDLTPSELFHIDAYYKHVFRNSSIYWKFPDGNEVRTDSHLAKDRYPELSFLYNNFDELYSEHKDNEKACSVLDEIEANLKEIENAETSKKEPDLKEEFDALRKWYKGELDSGFYYSTLNDELLSEWIADKISDAVKKESVKESTDYLK